MIDYIRKGMHHWRGAGRLKRINVQYLLQRCLRESISASTISEVQAADWHELMIPQRINKNVDIHCPRTIGPVVQHADIPPPQLATLGHHPVDRKLLLISLGS